MRDAGGMASRIFSRKTVSIGGRRKGLFLGI